MTSDPDTPGDHAEGSTVAVPTREEVRGWTGAERAELARLLDELLDRPVPGPRETRLRRVVLVITAVGAAILLPWVVYLSLTLPPTESGGAWSTAWVGFDVALATSLGITAWLAWRRRQVVLVGLAVSATLVVTDAWFDVSLSWHTSEQVGAMTSAILVELPVAVLLTTAALTILGRTATTVAQLRGQTGPPPSLWRQPLVLVPPTAKPGPGGS